MNLRYATTFDNFVPFDILAWMLLDLILTDCVSLEDVCASPRLFPATLLDNTSAMSLSFQKAPDDCDV